MRRLTIIAALLLCITACVTAQTAEEENKYLKGLLQPGTVAPDFAFENTDSTADLRLSSLRGRYVVLDFWASWCPDCRRDIPDMKRLHRRFASDSIVFVSVSFDKDRDVWQRCVRDSAMTWLQHSELKPWKETRISKDYNISWIPTIYLIDPKGRVVMAALNAKKLAPALRRLVKTGSLKPKRMDKESRDSIINARFPDGMKAFKSYIKMNTKYPGFAKKCKVMGTVVMNFKLLPDGSLKDIKALDCRITGYNKQKMGEYTDEEQKTIEEECIRLFALEGARVIKDSPKWNADTKSKTLSMYMPLNFSMNLYKK